MCRFNPTRINTLAKVPIQHDGIANTLGQHLFQTSHGKPVFLSPFFAHPTTEEWPHGEQDTDRVRHNKHGDMLVSIVCFNVERQHELPTLTLSAKHDALAKHESGLLPVPKNECGILYPSNTPPPNKMPTCSGTTKTGRQCSRRVNHAGDFCHQHLPVGHVNAPPPAPPARPPPPPRAHCTHQNTNGTQCRHHARPNDEWCVMHRRRHTRIQFQINRPMYLERFVKEIQDGRHWREVMDVVWELWWKEECIPDQTEYLNLRADILMGADVPFTEFKSVMLDFQHLVADWLAKRPRISAMQLVHSFGPTKTLEFVDDLTRMTPQQVQQRVDQGVYSPKQAPRQELGRLATDGQNVHTRYVVKQTNDTTQYLLKHAPTKWLSHHQEVFQSVRNTILDLNKRDDVKRDVKRWFNTSTCRTENDYLYKKYFMGLMELLTHHPHREELLKRCGEELVESVGMCCEGHISRLCNVLVGFDVNVKHEVSAGEYLQDKMAEIARKETSVEEKQEEARIVLREMGLPETEQQVWIEAL